jgi:nicotinamide riboside kinase
LLVPEVSREYLNQKISRDSQFIYSEIDLLEIAGRQLDMEKLALSKSPDTIVCDTDLLVMIIWSEVRFGHCHTWILDAFDECLANANRHYLLCDHHIPWEPDPLREHADSRGELFKLYKQKLAFYDLPYTVVNGTPEARLSQARKSISS